MNSARKWLLPVLLAQTIVMSLSVTALKADPLGDVDKGMYFGGSPKVDQSMDILIKQMKKRVHEEDRVEFAKQKLGDVNAASQPDRNDAFDGSEYKASTFTDTDFSMHSYRDLFGSPTPDMKKMELDHDLDVADARDDRMKKIEKERKLKAYRDKIDYLSLIKPVYFLPGSWDPSALDPLDNGGFTQPTFNGTPVPYRLNGHVDMQRNLPWKD